MTVAEALASMGAKLMDAKTVPRPLIGNERERYIASRYCPSYIREHPERYDLIYTGGTEVLWSYSDAYYEQRTADAVAQAGRYYEPQAERDTGGRENRHPTP